MSRPAGSRESPDALRAWGAFLRAHADLTAEMDQTLRARTGVPLQWYDVLAQIAATRAPATMRQLQERVLLSQSGLSRLVARLVEVGLVSRASSDHDKRSIEVTLTRLGQSRLRAARAVQAQQVRDLFARHMDEHEAAVVLAVLQRLHRDRPEG